MALTNRVVAPRYANALLQVAEEQQQTAQVHADMQALDQLMTTTPELLSALSSKALSESAKAALLKNVTDDACPLVASFINLVNDYGRISGLQAITQAFLREHDQALGIVHATVYTAVNLSDDQTARMAAALREPLSAKEVQLTQQLDPTVLGGVKVVANNRIIDGTIATRLAKLRQQLLTN